MGRQYGLGRREAEEPGEDDECCGSRQERAGFRRLEPELRAQLLQAVPPEDEQDERNEPDECHERRERGDERDAH
jgi:hypothetical protein